MDEQTPVIAVIGAASAGEDALEIARSLGRAIALRNWHLVCGGGSGVMEAACQGFRSGRNEVSVVRAIAIGVLPGETGDEANSFVDLVIPTGLGFARNAMITRMCNGVISVAGCSGTLSEMAFAWQMGKPIASMRDSGGWSEKLAGTAIDDRREDTVFPAESPTDALDFMEDRFAQRPQ